MSARGSAGTGSPSIAWPRALALAFGAAYTVVGIVGFFVTGFDDSFGHAGEELVGFEINPLHNVVHVVIGVAGLLLARTLAGARTYGWLLGIGFGAAFVYGLLAVDASWDFLAINWADNVLHAISAAVGFAIALGPVSSAVTGRTTRV